jgi:guanylate kinase
MKTIVTITGATCSGKTYLVENLTENHSFDKIISMTTRPPRQGEKNGEHYHFVSQFLFNSLDDRKLLLEKTQVGPHFYGIPIDEMKRIQARNKIPVAIVDPSGVGHIRDRLNDYPELKLFSIYLEVPLDVRLERFLLRFKQDNVSQLSGYTERLKNIFNEEQNWKKFTSYDYVMEYQKNWSVNDYVEQLLLRVNEIEMVSNRGCWTTIDELCDNGGSCDTEEEYPDQRPGL